jgi:hypothetical protein
MKFKIKKPLKWYQIIGWEIEMHFTFATKWNDLTDWQIRMIGKFMFQNRDAEVEKTFLRSLIVVILAIPRPTLKSIIKATILLCSRPLSEMRAAADFVLDETQELTRFPETIFINKWAPRKRITVFGPSARLANVTINELSFADTFFYRWEKDRDIMDLHRLTAILFRPNGTGATDEDMRAPFSKLLLGKNALITDRIPLHVKYMIAKAYKGCRNNFIEKHPNVFPKRRPSENEDKPRPYQPFSKIIDSFAMDEIQIFGTHQQVEKVLAPDFFKVFDESIRIQREREMFKK